MRKAFNYIFYYVQQMIYSSFENDQINFREKYRKNIHYLNVISALFSSLIFLFAFISVFITINNFINPIKDSTYRLNQSFYYIKKYNREIK